MLPVKSKGGKLMRGSREVQRGAPSAEALPAKLQRIKLFLCDVDGILTDGGVYMGGESEFKRFNILDGLGLRFLQRQGIKVGWISARPSFATTQRAADLKIDFLHQSDTSKTAAAEAMMARCNCGWEEVCYMGDDIVDLGLLRRAGVAVTVPHAMREVQLLAHYVTRSSAGQGVVREVVELILKAQGKWQDLVDHFSQ